MSERAAGGAYALAGDIGGTKTYMGLYEVTPRGGGSSGGDTVELRVVREARMENAGRSGVEELIGEFLSADEAGRIRAAAFGVACPVESNRCELTNLDWVVDGEALSRELGVPEVQFINDLVATARGVALLGEDDMVALKAGVERQGNIGLVAAGTGLGVAHLFWDGTTHHPSPSEGGHADFAPVDELQVELWRFLAERFGHVSYERILSGPGLVNLFDFFVVRSGAPVEGALAASLERPGVDAASVIVAEATGGNGKGDERCVAALDAFVRIYGAEAGNMALRCLALGGIYLGGGIAPKILSTLQKGTFVSAFVDKGRFRPFMERIPVRVIMNDRTALFGAAAYAAALVAGEPGAAVKMVRG